MKFLYYCLQLAASDPQVSCRLMIRGAHHLQSMKEKNSCLKLTLLITVSVLKRIVGEILYSHVFSVCHPRLSISSYYGQLLLVSFTTSLEVSCL